ncbi:hypothetical protein Pfo_004610 [Paulownia fortunei]|nr:hypothetical protein Pfo_004610 [Paulownia fortunei]
MYTNGKAYYGVIFGSLLINMLVSYAETQLLNADDLGQRNLRLGQERVTKLRFYVQDLVGGDNPTVWKVAQSNLTDILPSAFGLVSVLDNLVTSGPEIDSKEGKYKGSTLSILGRNPLDDKIREVPIVGGTGAFRMARGYAHTHGIIEYDVVVYHVDDINYIVVS